MRYFMAVLIGLIASAMLLRVTVSCAEKQDPPGCQPQDAQAFSAMYAAEAAPIVQRGECDGYTSRTCPALAPARDRFEQALADWKRRCGGTP